MDFSMVFDFKSAIILFGVFQTLALAGIFFKNGFRDPLKWLGFLMLSLCIIELESFLNYTGAIVYLPHLVNASPPIILVLGPLVFIYAKSLSIPTAETNKTWYWHFLPAALFLAYSSLFFLQPAAYKLYVVMRDFHPDVILPKADRIFSVDPLNIRGWIIIEGASIHLLFYAVSAFVVSFRAAEGSHTKWSRFLTSNLLLGSLVFLLTGGTVNGRVIFQPLLPAIASNIYGTVLVYSISVFWLCQITFPAGKLKKYAKSQLPPDIRNQKLSQIQQIMDTEKIYTSPDFNPDLLARRLSLSSHHLSQIINAETGMSFTEFANQYRINEAMRLLSKPQAREIKIEALAYELGYQSKSAFFVAFRRATSTTPARYRELHA